MHYWSEEDGPIVDVDNLSPAETEEYESAGIPDYPLDNDMEAIAEMLYCDPSERQLG